MIRVMLEFPFADDVQHRHECTCGRIADRLKRGTDPYASYVR